MKYVIYTSILAVIFVVGSYFNPDKRVFNADPAETTVSQTASIYSYHTEKALHQDYASIESGVAEKGTKVRVMEYHHYWYKILLPDGTMGWIREENLEPTRMASVRYNSDETLKLYSKPGKKDPGDTVSGLVKREWVERTGEYHTEKIGSTETVYARVRTADGDEGWIRASLLERVGWKQPRLIDRREWRYNRPAFVKKWKGRSIEEFMDKFAEPYAIKNEGDTRIYIFSNIYLYNKTRKEIGIQAITKNGSIEDFNYSGRKRIWIGYFPFSQELRMPFIMNSIWDIFSIGEKEALDEYGDRDHKSLFNVPKWLSIVLLILFIISFLALYYLIFYVPYFIAHKITYRQSLNRKLLNGVIFTIAVVSALVLGYPYFIFCNVNIGVFNEWFVVHFLFVLGMTLGFIQMWNTDLKYVRCSACRFWSGIDNGSKLISKWESTTTYGDGRKEKGTKEVWMDYRLCNRPECGHEWKIRRTYYSGRYRD